ncbi:bifunctional folylpolyglutamate synthase/dihydrofolate synthase [Ehrlichia ruminantium]|uniref:Dihydrofolate synthase/folylpolyglutamate synthase n=1 Tax=Ehrlichia ruminantium (strain Welgevonden) TaxID=254945 RepID=A0A0H3LZQ5_EHRRW|nr:folylpolyglutamate synthase/dihydrofolate synthase family protein [Ehrlichia ruminantium]QLK50444.1 bifunctional folylpolyglutamate synthase/dihydrofolate synthase [Ehrlichia ruminantium]QLK51369.1 bifunctional folylpolyglutamate synthase/dihydrofolate synthase [Ehrlichia ruminantium]QLK53204.1 bifunctional folylpolyglutamate synthase/dihydrofolate synthase [Ehrlichia ruminantium]QLK55044.1 bifunctional folylpolyglutamate synthase/dihydrofolate synthase [Ehrlichia ruminantium]QLK55961.1 bif
MVYMPHWPKPLGFRPSDMVLDRIVKLLNNLGDPQKKLPPVIHVAGTNGKGSTMAFLRYILNAAGLKTHVYTSPHLVEFNERVIVADKKISDNYLYEALEICREASVGIPVTFFEGTTAAVFLVFSQVDADIVLIETGLGGRLDATNVLDPILTIITSISLEHIEVLGDTVELIAAEKAGIMKKDVTCVIAPQSQDSIMKVFEYYAMENNVPLYRGGIDWFCEKQDSNILFKNSVDTLSFPLPSLPGKHQVINVGNAIAACSILAGKFHYDIDYDNIAHGITQAYWPARLEKITTGFLHNMIPQCWELFLDGAHNPGGASVLADWIKDSIVGDLYVIVGMTRDKDSVEFLSYLKPYIKFLSTVCVKSEPRAQTANELLQVALSLGMNAIASDTLTDAISGILEVGDHTKKSTILICGSLFLAGDVLLENNVY